MSSKGRLTGLQRQVLHFYRAAARAAGRQPEGQRQQLRAYVRQEFERYRSVDRKDYQLIEHLLRKGGRQLQMLRDASVTGFQLHTEPASGVSDQVERGGPVDRGQPSRPEGPGTMAPSSHHPKSWEQIYADWEARRAGLETALTEEQDLLWLRADPEKDNLCLYGEADGTWSISLPADEVPPELPEPCLGINFARDGMKREDWLSLVAVHSDTWLLSVAFYYGARLDPASRQKLFRHINEPPTLYELVTGKHRQRQGSQPSKRRREGREPTAGGPSAKAAESPLPTGRLLTYNDIVPSLKGRQAELYWPEDKMWYLVEIQSINTRTRQAKIQYTSGEVEELDLEEIIREGHMSLITS